MIFSIWGLFVLQISLFLVFPTRARPISCQNMLCLESGAGEIGIGMYTV